VTFALRKVLTFAEQVHADCGKSDGGPLLRVATAAVFANPFAGQAPVEDLSALVEGSAALGTLLGRLAAQALNAPVESYGKAALVGTAGEQEHANACITTAFGDQFREAVGGGRAWISSVTKRCGPGTRVDVPLAYKDDIWVRSHYDTLTITVEDAPLSDELVVICAVASRGRLHARLGGKTKEEADSET
jgi:hypothetical protein